MNVTSIHAFAEKVVLISDVSDPIGRAAALQLGLQGAFVVGGLPVGNTDDGSIADLVSLGTLASSVEYDSPLTLKEAVEQKFGRLDLLINCVKYPSQSDFNDDVERRFETQFADSVRQMYLLTEACLDLMKERPKPKMVNVVRRFDQEKTGTALATASQEAVISLTRSLAKELPSNFRCNVISVPYSEAVADTGELFLRPAGFAADDAARAIQYLLSSESIAVNGQLIELR